MKERFKKLTALLLVVLLLLCACGEQEELPEEQGGEQAQPLTITIALGGAQDTLEPTYSTADGGETILYHLYENLMRWEDDGNGFAVLAPGQAESYTVETDYAGNATYTFTLRNDIVWSDGQNVTSYQFAAAWQRLADPAYDSPHREMMSCIAGYDEVQTTGDPSLLKVSTPDARTLVVTLNGSVPHFLTVVCAGAYTMPIRTYLPGNSSDQIVTNGAYTVAEFSQQLVKLVKNDKYYDCANVSVEEIRFAPATGSEADYTGLVEGKLDFVCTLPTSALQELAASENWLPEPVTSTYGIMLNTLAAPFDNADVRKAFRLAVDEQAIVDALADFTSRPAVGLIPYGVSDYGAAPVEEEQTEQEQIPDPNAPAPEDRTPVWYDFRAHGSQIITLEVGDDYEIDCTWARTLLAGAGYAGGSGFPEVEYIYVDTPENRVVAEALQSCWQTVLGVTVTLRALTAEEYAQMLHPTCEETEGEEESVLPAFQIAAAEFIASYDDPYELLSRWHSESAENFGGYTSVAFDILMNAAAAAETPESYDAYLHDAEAILIEDAPVIPVFYRGGSCALADGLEGLYRAPNGIFFFSKLTNTVETQ